MERTDDRESGPWTLKRFSVISANSTTKMRQRLRNHEKKGITSLTRHYSEGRGKGRVLGSLGKGLKIENLFRRALEDLGMEAHQIPSLLLDTPELILCHYRPYTIRDVGAILECEIQLQLIADSVV